MARYDGCATKRSCESSGVFLTSCTNCPKKIKVNNATKQGLRGCRLRRQRSSFFSEQQIQTRAGGTWHSSNAGYFLQSGNGFRRMRTNPPPDPPASVGSCKASPMRCLTRLPAVNSDSQLYRQAGNSVTIPVVYAVGKRIVAIQNELDAKREGEIL